MSIYNIEDDMDLSGKSNSKHFIKNMMVWKLKDFYESIRENYAETLLR